MSSNRTDAKFNNYILVSAIVKNKATGNPVADGTIVTFMTSYGGKFDDCGCNRTTAVTKNGNGNASVNVTAWGSAAYLSRLM